MVSKDSRIKFTVLALLSFFVISYYGSTLLGQESITPRPVHSRPYFMPKSQIEAIRNLILMEPWAKSEYERIKKAVREVNSDLGKIKFNEGTEAQKIAFWAAFLYAIEGDQVNFDVARKWLMQAYADNSRETILSGQALNDPEYWKGSKKEIPWHRLDFDAYVAYDWIWLGLSIEERSYLANSFILQTRFRMAYMDTWNLSASQNFEVISMVAFTGMALYDRWGSLNWGWSREERQGSFYSMMDNMFKDGAVWGEGAKNAVANSTLYCVTTMAFYRSMYENKSWYDHQTPSGTSVRKIVNYYINTSYPPENTGVGNGRIRVATYGDGSTSPHSYSGGEHDLFIGGAQPNSQSRPYNNLMEALAMGYAGTKDPGIAPFLALYPDYKPNLWNHPPLPETLNWPKAPSNVWPEFGIAMLRSDETPGYFTNQDAIAVFQMMTKSYGHHQQPDKFHINLHGAGRLIYTDFSGKQYEDLLPGWTNTSVGHNTMLVDEKDTEPAKPYIRSDFTPEVKFLSTSASEVFSMVDQTRGLMLTNEYLLDLFQASSKIPRTYDYLLHSTGVPSPVTPSKFKSKGNISQKYWALDAPKKTITPDQWSLDFILEKQQPKSAVPGLGSEWFDHVARCRVTMAAEDNTLVCYGTWGEGLYLDEAIKAATASVPGREERKHEVSRIRESAGPIGMLIVRRPECLSTVFAATHEPYSNDQKPLVTSISKVARTDAGLVVRVRGENFTDYAAIAWGKGGDKDVHLLAGENGQEVFSFKNYAWLRIPDEGTPIARGEWIAFRIPGNKEKFVFNDQKIKLNQSEGNIIYGKIPSNMPQP